MKSQPGLTENGERIFKELVTHTTGAGMENIDSYRLTELAFAMDLHQKLREKMVNATSESEKLGIQMTQNKYETKNATVQVLESTGKTIDSLSAKFGITPGDRGKFITSKPKKVHPLNKFKKSA